MSLFRKRSESKDFSALFREHAPFVWRALRRHGVPERELDDLCQEVFLIVHRRLPEFEGRSTLRTWIYGIAARVALAYRRKAHVRREDLGAEPPQPELRHDSPHDEVERRQSMRLLEAGMHRLSEAKREAFALVDLEHVDVEEAAAMLGCPEGTVYSRVYAARRELTAFVERAQQRAVTPALASEVCP